MRRSRSYPHLDLKYEISGLLLIALAIFGFLSLYFTEAGGFVAWKAMGATGSLLARALQGLAGKGRYLLPLLLGAAGAKLMYERGGRFFSRRVTGVSIGYLAFLVWCHLRIVETGALGREVLATGWAGEGGGILGALPALLFNALLGPWGNRIFLVVFFLISLLLVTSFSLTNLVIFLGLKLQSFFRWIHALLINFLYTEEEVAAAPSSQGVPVVVNAPERLAAEAEASATSQEDFKLKAVAGGNPKVKTKQELRAPRREDFLLPPLELLKPPAVPKNHRSNKEIMEKAKLLESTLENFGVKVQVTQISCGPAVTRYEVHPAPGIKVSRIVSLADDIALSLAAQGVRIEAPIPGKAAVGIEVPNKEVAVVSLREVLETPEFQRTNFRLPVALGKDIAGNPVVADLTKMPHLLIAGATGSGKSVCLNALICSLLFRRQPTELKFMMIDPKMVELTDFNRIPQLIAPVVTNAKKAANALRWMVTEMEKRYAEFAAVGVRDLDRYNYFYARENPPEPEPALPYIVVIIDELADLMFVSPTEVEDAICRLAQMARAAGIHLVVATQRPSVDVITGLIKANIPSRIAFAVSSQTDSRTILDTGGAEKLLGRGDMLFLPVEAAKPVRVQGAYVTDKEVEDIVNFLRKQGKPDYSLEARFEKESIPEEEDDKLFSEAVRLLLESEQASTSFLQRRLRIGYNRAARLIEMMEERGIISRAEGTKPRRILIGWDDYQRLFGEE